MDSCGPADRTDHNCRRLVRAAAKRSAPLRGSLADLAQQMEQFHARFRACFRTRTLAAAKKSKEYLCGLIQAEKKNMERMAEVVPNTDDQAYQHFLSNSPWSHRAVLDQIAQEVDATWGESDDYFLVVDESAFAKKGRDSVGVARQWNGRLGKVDNCQVGVFTALGCGQEVTLADERLFLPEEWTKDAKRCKKAKIPAAERTFRTKAQLAYEMVRDARRRGLRFRWVGLDGGYGKEPWLLRALDRDGEVWVADVHRDQRIYLEDPRPAPPERRHHKGRTPSRPVAQSQALRVDQWAAQYPDTAWQPVALRESTKGTLTVEVLHRLVWLWDGKEPQAHRWHLVVRREVGSPAEIKYTLSNGAETTSTQRLAYQQGQRFWVEQALRNAKSEAGLGDYQLRLWLGWHHHMAMVMLAMLFMLEVRSEHKEELSLLSCHDIVEVLRVLLPRANVTYEEVLRQLQERHRRRQASIDAAYRRQRCTLSSGGP